MIDPADRALLNECIGFLSFAQSVDPRDYSQGMTEAHMQIMRHGLEAVSDRDDTTEQITEDAVVLARAILRRV